MSTSKTVKPASRPFVIGTSGHIDHGKTTLVKALTGVDTDRWAEEKKRGITIDLGFAHYEDEQGNQLAFVDVPGHEKFIHNMLAGVAGMDAVLLVVAADEGVMPQTREHLNICNLLKIKTGLVAITRIDLVEDSDMVELCQDEVAELLEGTFLEGKPVIPVSTTSGEGLTELRQALSKLGKQIPAAEIEKPFRLSVDRSFTLKGFGTVVTGTVLSGSLRQDEEVQQFPQQRSVRIRGLQAHSQTVSEVFAGQRAALNLAGITKEEIQRGDQLAKEGSLLTSYMLNASLTLLEDVSAALKNRTRIRLHLGSQEVFGRIVLLEGETLSPGKTTLVQFRLESLVCTRHGDRFIVRSYSPMFTLGGGMVIDPSPSKSRRVLHELSGRLRRLHDGDENVRSAEVIYLQSVKGVIEAEFSVRSGLSAKQSAKILQLLQSQQQVLCVDPFSKRYLHVQHVERIGEFLSKVLTIHHKKFADREGMTRSELGGKLSLIFTEKEVEILLKYMIKLGKFVQNGQYFSLAEHQPQVSQAQEAGLAHCFELIKAGGFQPYRRTRLLEELEMNEQEGVAMLKSAVHSKRLVRVADDLYYAPEQTKEILISLRKYLQDNQSITVIQFKELLNISRKHAIDLLEYFDSQHLTIREDNHRVPGSILASNE
ncbi:MAG: selenocysteine-specific translation elongation factor [SAR324 cluster bacterium]|jgi:selenocysteine-specific elongation factor|nr:selenocysteine-specific translation elongation factor [SAR324 cluster bacterium]MDP6295641.1 selenocysteine-specific translation elongation factor [SAR324 cluster bacterium]|tara:strand:- start:2502 stop:4460 length:1959 start_codon:yes stop_codon:yes gene_type:complete